jgi:hypothetical protein
MSTVLLSPDSGPAHMATMVGLPVIGLYAATNPARAGPYYSRQWCVDKYDAAARQYLGRPAAQIPWTTKIERRGVMDLIEVGEVTAKLDALMAPAIFAKIHAMQAIKVPISPGELLDKITILRIKSQRMSDTAKVSNVRLELNALEETWRASAFATIDIEAELGELLRVNERLWAIEDDIRDKERAQAFDAEFVRLARAVYIENDERAVIKRRINVKLGSGLIEEKSYREYKT